MSFYLFFHSLQHPSVPSLVEFSNSFFKHVNLTPTMRTTGTNVALLWKQASAGLETPLLQSARRKEASQHDWRSSQASLLDTMFFTL